MEKSLFLPPRPIRGVLSLAPTTLFSKVSLNSHIAHIRLPTFYPKIFYCLRGLGWEECSFLDLYTTLKQNIIKRMPQQQMAILKGNTELPLFKNTLKTPPLL